MIVRPTRCATMEPMVETMVRRSLSRLVVVLPLLGTACVLTAYEPNDGLSELRAQQRTQADRVARALCASYYSCGCEDTYPMHETEAECVELIEEGVFARLEQGIDDGLDYDPTCLDIHAELLETLGCAADEDIPPSSELRWLIETTDRCFTYHGSHDIGEDCLALPTARGHDCMPGLACAEVAICIDAAPVALGEPCASGMDQPCAAGLTCAYAQGAIGRVCAPVAELGETCFDSAACSDDTWCDFSVSTCKARAQLGESCATALCAYTLVCTSGTCTEGAGPSEPCPPEGCGFGLTCGDGGTCEARRAIACDYEERLP